MVVIQEGIIRSLKGDATDMVQYLSPVALVKTILDKLDSVYTAVSNFNVLMQGLFQEIQSRTKTVACFFG